MARERTIRTQGVILRRSDFGEADRLLTIYSRDFGKVRAIAKGARKPQSRKTGHIELFMQTDFLLAKGRGDLFIATQAEMINAFPSLREDLVRTTYAAYVCELLDKMTADEDKHVSIYDLLVSALGWLADTEDVLLAARYYELRISSMAGFQPQLFHCVVSGDPIEEEAQLLSAELGGLMHAEYYQNDPRAIELSAVAVKVLRYLQSRSWDTVKVLTLKTALHRELEQAMHYYLTFILERNLKSFDFLHRLRQEAALFLADEDSEIAPE